MVNKRNGFTLIEIMITVAIVALVAAIAYPSYQDSIMKSRRGAAQAVMMDVAQRQQQYLMDMRGYAADYPTLYNGMTQAQVVPDAVHKRYDITFVTTAGPPPTFTITATPRAGKGQVKDGPLTLDHQGVRTPDDKW